MIIWLSDGSTYEEVSGQVIQVLTREGEQAIENGEELKDWTSEEYSRYVKKEISLVGLLDFYNEAQRRFGNEIED